MKFRRIKPGEIFEAFKWTGGPDQIEDPEWFCELLKNNKAYFDQANVCMIFTCPDTQMLRRAYVGEYIIKNQNGALSKCHADYFEAEYIPVQELEAYYQNLSQINNEVITNLRQIISNQEVQIKLLNEKIDLINKQE